MSENISLYECILRYVLGAVLTVLSVITLQIPVWVAIIATYPIFTALVQWDPLYALFEVIRNRVAKGATPVTQAYA